LGRLRSSIWKEVSQRELLDKLLELRVESLVNKAETYEADVYKRQLTDLVGPWGGWSMPEDSRALNQHPMIEAINYQRMIMMNKIFELKTLRSKISSSEEVDLSDPSSPMYELVSQMSEIEYLPHPRGTSYRKKQHL
jgi:hypothetical protein